MRTLHLILFGLLLLVPSGCRQKRSTRDKPEPGAMKAPAMKTETLQPRSRPAARRRPPTPTPKVQLASADEIKRFARRARYCSQLLTVVSALHRPDAAAERKEILDRNEPADRKACAAGVPKACWGIWAMHRKAKDPAGKATARRFSAKAIALYEKACATQPTIEACDHLADEYCVGLSVPKSAARCKRAYRRVLPLIQKACDHGDAEWCRLLAVRLADPKVSQRDPNQEKALPIRARKLATAQCAKGSADACDKLHLWWSHGIGGPKDLAKAARFGKRALAEWEAGCKKGKAIDCIVAGITYADKPPKNVARAKKLWARARALLRPKCLGKRK